MQAALDELRDALVDDRVDMGELVILGAHEKLARLRAERDDTAALRRRLADRVRRRDIPADRVAADEVRRAGWALVTNTLLLDNSAWVRLGDTGLPAQRGDELAGDLESGHIATCLPFLLEAGYSARTAREHDQLLAELLSLPHYRFDEAAEHRALDAQAQLARVGHHRLPPVDLLIAALADRHGLGILHYDHDYDLIAEKTDLSFDSVWLATEARFDCLSAPHRVKVSPFTTPKCLQIRHFD